MTQRRPCVTNPLRRYGTLSPRSYTIRYKMFSVFVDKILAFVTHSIFCNQRSPKMRGTMLLLTLSTALAGIAPFLLP